MSVHGRLHGWVSNVHKTNDDPSRVWETVKTATTTTTNDRIGRYNSKLLQSPHCAANCLQHIQSFQPPYHFIVLPRVFHSTFFHLIVFFIEKNVFALVLKIAFSNTRTQAHSQAVVLLVVVLQERRILISSNTSSKANYGLCAETGKTAAAMTNFSGFTKSTVLLTAVIFSRFAAIFFFLLDRISIHF